MSPTERSPSASGPMADAGGGRAAGRLGRRLLLGALIATPLGGAASRETRGAGTRPLPVGLSPRAVPSIAVDLAEWAAYKARYLLPDGRAVDTANGGVSHSEGQGFTLLLAEAMDDRATFELALGWTFQALRRRGDALLAWRWRPVPRQSADDLNNATDGDLLVAWALLRAAERWGVRAWRAEALDMVAAVRRKMVVEVSGRLLLLPGSSGFSLPDRVVVNPSYYVFGALRAFAAADDGPYWRRVEADGLALLREVRFGRWALPADWVSVPRNGGAPVPAQGWPARFSWDAVRVPLYLAWAGLRAEPALRAAAAFWGDPRNRHMPAWTELGTDEISPYRATAGIVAVAGLATAAAAGGPPPTATLAIARVAAATDYYGAALTLLVRVAAREGWARGVA